MPGRNFTASNYRYGYNSQEIISEINGSNSSYSFEFRIYDSRLGRFSGSDPIRCFYPSLSPYQFAGNSPIQNMELEGLQQGNATLEYTNTAPQLKQKTFGDFVTERLEKELNSGLKKPKSFGLNPLALTLGFIFTPQSMGTGDVPYKFNFSAHPQVAPIQIITDNPSEDLSDWEWMSIKLRVESGQGTPIDHKYYNQMISKAPFNTSGIHTQQDHHIIPKALFKNGGSNVLIQKALKVISEKGFDDEWNIIPLSTKFHKGPHKAYTNKINSDLEDLNRSFPTVNDEEAAVLIKDYVNSLKSDIIDFLNSNPEPGKIHEWFNNSNWSTNGIRSIINIKFEAKPKAQLRSKF